ncbi:MAG: U32 family peptidase [Clostridiales bacterium]|jgi:putative protease|nr:U32 family peptidase [Clostridiales bacterium]
MPELLAPAGNFSKLQTAFQYGADAVYFGNEDFSLRSSGFNDEDSLASGILHAHTLGKKAYITANIFAHNRDLNALTEYIKLAKEFSADAIIVSDLGVFELCQRHAPNIDIHISTQANCTNSFSAQKWHEMGAKRIIPARELSFDEIREIRQNTAPELELELFVHGAMCVAYSGRCLLSSYLAERDANKGECAQPCRWEFELLEAKSGNHIQAFENRRGSFFFNSKDLCLIRRIADLAEIGVNSLKIEGRNKSEYYLATIVKAYRTEIDNFLSGQPLDPNSLDEVEKVSHREYCEGFAFGAQAGQVYSTSSYIRNCDVVAVILDCQERENGDFRLLAEQRNKINRGDALEILQPVGKNIAIDHAEIFDEEDAELASTPHAAMKYWLKCPIPAQVGSFVRNVHKI